MQAVQTALSGEHNKKRKFTQSVDLAITLKDIDLKKPENRIDEEIELPKGRGVAAKVGVFASGELAFKAKDVADAVITPEELNDLAGDKLQAKQMANTYDFFIAEAPLMPTIGRALGRTFAPRGKMPKPIPSEADIAAEVQKLRGSIRVRSKDKMTFHCLVGREDMPQEDIAENVETVLQRVEGKLERGRMNIKSAYLSTTMGSSARLV
jgi:large subunit ribosomal protein L1